MCALLPRQGLCYTCLFGHANELNANSPQTRFWKAIVTFISLCVFALHEAIISFFFHCNSFSSSFYPCVFQASEPTRSSSGSLGSLLFITFHPSPFYFCLSFYLNMECKIRIIHLCILHCKHVLCKTANVIMYEPVVCEFFFFSFVSSVRIWCSNVLYIKLRICTYLWTKLYKKVYILANKWTAATLRKQLVFGRGAILTAAFDLWLLLCVASL